MFAPRGSKTPVLILVSSAIVEIIFGLNCDSSTSTSFLICETCDQVTELKQRNLPEYFVKQSEQANFKYAKHNLEIYGTCKTCQNNN